MGLNEKRGWTFYPWLDVYMNDYVNKGSEACNASH